MSTAPWPPDEPSMRHRSTRGEVVVWFPAPRVIVYKYTGFTDGSHARFIDRTFDQRFSPDQRNIHLFVDTEDQTGYEAEFRHVTGKRAERIQELLDTYCLLVKSRVIAFGIHLIGGAINVTRTNGLTARFSTLSDREVFRSRIEAAVRISHDAALA